MRQNDHVNLLHHYASRLTLGDIENILKCQSSVIREELIGDSSTRNQAQMAFYAAICESIKNIPRRDLAEIESSINA